MFGCKHVKATIGNTVRAYDRERTICDVFRYKDAMDIQVFQHAMRSTWPSR